MPARNKRYPVKPENDGDDPRFTFGLMVDVGDVLTQHGYPTPTGDDHVRLMSALFRFLYSDSA